MSTEDAIRMLRRARHWLTVFVGLDGLGMFLLGAGAGANDWRWSALGLVLVAAGLVALLAAKRRTLASLDAIAEQMREEGSL